MISYVQIMASEFLRLRRIGVASFSVSLFFMMFLMLSHYFMQDFEGSAYPILIWLGLAFSCFLGIHHFIEEDFQRGFIDFYLTENFSLPLYLFIKIIIWWALILSPLILISFIFGALIGLEVTYLSFLTLGFTASTMIIASLACFFSVLLIGVKQANLILAVLLLPLLVPMVIMGNAIHVFYHDGASPMAFIWLLFGVSFLCLTVVPSLTASLLKKSQE